MREYSLGKFLVFAVNTIARFIRWICTFQSGLLWRRGKAKGVVMRNSDGCRPSSSQVAWCEARKMAWENVEIKWGGNKGTFVAFQAENSSNVMESQFEKYKQTEPLRSSIFNKMIYNKDEAIYSGCIKFLRSANSPRIKKYKSSQPSYVWVPFAKFTARSDHLRNWIKGVARRRFARGTKRWQRDLKISRTTLGVEFRSLGVARSFHVPLPYDREGSRKRVASSVPPRGLNNRGTEVIYLRSNRDASPSESFTRIEWKRNGKFRKSNRPSHGNVLPDLCAIFPRLFFFKHRSEALLVNGICESFPGTWKTRSRGGIRVGSGSFEPRSPGGGILRDIVQVSELGLASFIPLLPR